MIIEGVAPACHVLQTTSDGRYALAGSAASGLREGDHVTVDGTLRTDLVSRCGRAFVVATLTRASP